MAIGQRRSGVIAGRLWCATSVALLAAVICLGQQTPAAGRAQQLYRFTHPAMGTEYTLLLYADTAPRAAEEAERAFTEVDDVESLLSNYQPQSELSRINRLAGEQTVTTDGETFAFLERSLGWSARSDGAFDITVGALMKSWGFFRSSGHVPSSVELHTTGDQTGWQRVHLDRAARSVRFDAHGLELDPGGIGKGFAVDRVVQLLREDGVQAAMLSAGSSTIYGLGAPPGQKGWRVEIPNPVPDTQHPGAVLSTVVLRDDSLSTASCAEKHFVLAGHLYCHIMDPRVLRPVEERLQATVMAPSATDSDALSNVAFVDDDRERARFLETADASVRVLVVDGEPAPDAANNKARACLAYRWPGELGGTCRAAATKETP